VATEQPPVEQSPQEPPPATMTLPKWEDWQNVLGLMEAGTKAMGANFFIVGGVLIQHLAKQLPKPPEQQ